MARHPESYAEILSIPPGITGVSQLVFATEARFLVGAVDPVQQYQTELLPAKIAFDIGYVRHRSMLGDSALLVRTMILPARRLRSQAHGISLALRSIEVSLAVVAVLALVISFAWASQR